jgi:two-component system sensor histidine kinase HydH
MTMLQAQPAPRCSTGVSPVSLAHGQDAHATRLADFRRLLAAYQQSTERLKESHDALMHEVARLRAELASKDQQLERRKRLAALGEMAAGVAHEIRNPLGSIQLYADLLTRQLAGDPKRAELATKIGAAVRGLDAVVTDMLTFTRVIEAAPQPTAFADLLADVAAEAAGRLQSTGVALRVQAEPGLTINLDGRLFKRVLLNLVLNACDAMSPRNAECGIRNAESREILVTAEVAHGGPARWRIAVSDTGPGIAPDVLDKIFHPFFTTKDHGTGLGLAIVHHMIEAHGGTIAAANRPEGGAVFTILLP